MKTVYLLTFAGSVNYGAALQGYALYRAVSKMGYPCAVIDYNRGMHHRNYILPSFSQSSLKGKVFKLLSSGKKRALSKKFNSFVLKHEMLTKALNGNGALYNHFWDPKDIYLLGSDQVLNLDVTAGDFQYYLDFVESPNKIAYAPSFGTNQIPEKFKEKADELLRKFRCITVREESGQKLIEAATGNKPQVVLDPSFLLSSDEWKEIFIPPKEKDYILLFPFHQKSPCISAAQKYAEVTGLPLINITYMVEHVEGAKNIKNVSPEEWGGYVANAKKVFTDSFHGMVFSLIFHKNFQVELDKKSQKMSRNSRITDLLKRIDASEILDAMEPNYSKIEIALNREIEKSKKALSDMLAEVSSGE